MSRDGEWQVRDIILDGRKLYRIEARSVRNARLIGTRDHRTGIVRTAFGYAVADVIAPREVAQFVPLAELEEADTRESGH